MLKQLKEQSDIIQDLRNLNKIKFGSSMGQKFENSLIEQKIQRIPHSYTPTPISIGTQTKTEKELPSTSFLKPIEEEPIKIPRQLSQSKIEIEQIEPVKKSIKSKLLLLKRKIKRKKKKKKVLNFKSIGTQTEEVKRNVVSTQTSIGSRGTRGGLSIAERERQRERRKRERRKK
jgi:hypothetical protein